MEETINIFADYKSVSVILHVFSVIVVMGTAVVSDILFNIYIKDKKIDISENRTLNILSSIIWASLGFILLSGILIFFSDTAKYMNSPKFLLKMVIVGFIVINGYAFQRIVHPAIRKINFTDTNSHHKYVKVRRLAFAFGAISVTSWMSAFVLGSIPRIPVSFFVGLGFYLLMCFGAIVVSQLVEYRITHNKQ